MVNGELEGIEILLRHFLERAEENCEQSSFTAVDVLPRFEANISRIRMQSLTARPT
jgi:hypothetical protein